MASSHRSRGFTLVETMISLAVTAIVLAGAVLSATAQNRAHHKQQRLRTAQAASRDALVLLERTVPLAGYGMDASLALDFRWYTPAAGVCPSEMGGCPRDAIQNADELVFYARNPKYWVAPMSQTNPPAPKGKAWMLSSITSTYVKLDAHQGDQFLPGQILQVICPGTLNYAYFTVKTAAGPFAADTAGAQVDLLTVDANNPFKRQDVAAGLSMTTTCRVFQIDRYRLHVSPVAMGGGRYDPYLVLDDGVNPEVPLVEGVEAFQVSYVFASSTVGVVGEVPGTAVVWSSANADQTVTGPAPQSIARTNFPGNAPQPSQTTYTPSSFYQYVSTDPMRSTNHQANIRAVHIAMVLRSTEPDPASISTLGGAPYVVGPAFTLLNQQGVPDWVKNAPKVALLDQDGFQRVQVDTIINLPNMLVRSLPAF